MLCQAFADEVTELQKADASDEDLAAALVRSRETCDVLKRGTSNELSAGEPPSPMGHRSSCISFWRGMLSHVGACQSQSNGMWRPGE